MQRLLIKITAISLVIVFLLINQAWFIRHLGPLVAPSATFSFHCQEKIVALTIDDGPDPLSTIKILDVLKEKNASATFFIIGDRASPYLLNAIVNAGHELGNHTFHDVATSSLSMGDLINDVNKTHQLIEQYHPVHWFRPGQGQYNQESLSVITSKGYQLIMADVFPFDHLITSSHIQAWYINYSVKPGSIIVLHDYQARGVTTAKTLAIVLDQLKNEGYNVTSLSNLKRNQMCQ